MFVADQNIEHVVAGLRNVWFRQILRSAKRPSGTPIAQQFDDIGDAAA